METEIVMFLYNFCCRLGLRPEFKTSYCKFVVEDRKRIVKEIGYLENLEDAREDIRNGGKKISHKQTRDCDYNFNALFMNLSTFQNLKQTPDQSISC